MEEDEDLVGAARVSYGSDGQKGLRMDVDLDVNELTSHLGPAAKPLVAVARAIQSTIFYTAPVLALAGLLTQIAGITCSRYTKTQADKKSNKQGKASGTRDSKKSAVKEEQARRDAKKRQDRLEKEEKRRQSKEQDQRQRQEAKGKMLAKAKKPHASSTSIWGYLKRAFSSISPGRSKENKLAFVTRTKGGALLGWNTGGPSTSKSKDGEILDWNAFTVLSLRATCQWALLVAVATAVGRGVEAAGASRKLTPRLLLSLDVLTAFSAVFLSEKVGFLCTQMDMGWYHRVLKKPTWTPRPIVFPLVWVPLKLLQTAALVLVWRLLDRDALNVPVVLYLLHLTLGDLWNLVFFGEKRIGFGLSVMYAFYASLAASCYAFYSVLPRAAYLLVPTAVWVFIATSLNYSIWLLNGTPTRFPTKKG
jgi:tryptophan-rich sensory protein